MKDVEENVETTKSVGRRVHDAVYWALSDGGVRPTSYVFPRDGDSLLRNRPRHEGSATSEDFRGNTVQVARGTVLLLRATGRPRRWGRPPELAQRALEGSGKGGFRILWLPQGVIRHSATWGEGGFEFSWAQLLDKMGRQSKFTLKFVRFWLKILLALPVASHFTFPFGYVFNDTDVSYKGNF